MTKIYCQIFELMVCFCGFVFEELVCKDYMVSQYIVYLVQP